MRVLVTGGAGFIGGHVVEHLVSLGHEVVIADRFTYAAKARNLAPVLDRVALLYGDLSTGDLADRCAAVRPDWVVHMAAETHVDRAIEAPESFIVSNTVGTTRLLQALYREGCRYGMPAKILVYSTDEVYGSTPPGVAFDEHAPFKPSNAYSASKVGVEGITHAMWVTHRMPVVVVRPCNTYGPRQHPEKVIPKLAAQALRGEPMTVYNDGKGVRDWLYCTDHARAVVTLLERGEPGEAYNLAAGDEHCDMEIATRIAEFIYGKGINEDLVPHRVFQPGRPGHDRCYRMDGAKLRALGWSPEVPFKRGFHKTMSWCFLSQEAHWASDLVGGAHG